MKKYLNIAALLIVILNVSACARVFGNLRRDLNDDQAAQIPTEGGRYPAGYLEEEPEWSTPAHLDRSPASHSEGTDQEEGDHKSFGMPTRELPVTTGSVRRATRNDFVDRSQDSGSLWSSSGESNFFFSKNRARSPGDVLEITIESEMLRDIQAEVRRTLTHDEVDHELNLLESARAKRSEKDAAEGAETPLRLENVDWASVIPVKTGDSFLVEVLERHQNGNYKIRGSKRVPYRNAMKLMNLIGVVRGADISDEKTPSGKIYEYRLEVVR